MMATAILVSVGLICASFAVCSCDEIPASDSAVKEIEKDALYFSIQNSKSGLVLDIASEVEGAPVTMAKRNNGSRTQLWIYKDGMLVNAESKKALSLKLTTDQKDSSYTDEVTTYPQSRIPSQQWTFEADQTLKNGYGKVLDVFEGDTSNDARVIVSNKNGTANQDFRMIPENADKKISSKTIDRFILANVTKLTKVTKVTVKNVTTTRFSDMKYNVTFNSTTF